MVLLKRISYALIVTVVAALNIPPAHAQDSALEVQQQGNISYVSGGIGRDESNALEAVQKNYNLRITSADKSGHFYGNTRILVRNSQNDLLLDVVGGPLIYANLPNGRYSVEGFGEGQSKKQAFVITGRKPVTIHFNWTQMDSAINQY